MLQSLTQSQRNLIVGMCLGDTHAERNPKNCCLRIQHSLKQFELVNFKHSMLSPHSLSMTTYAHYDKRTKKTYQKIKFDTISHELFNQFHDIFYVDMEKIVPKSIEKLLCDPLALAVWYLDDGGLRADCNAFRIHTNSYRLSDVKLLQLALLKNFDIVTNVHRQLNRKPTDKIGNAALPTLENAILKVNPETKVENFYLEDCIGEKTKANQKGFCLYIPAEGGQAERFCKLIKPIVASTVPNMLYKFF